jgi:hypothetical protein
MAAQFTGRNGNMLFFTEGDRGVIVDSEFGVVVASGRASLLRPNATWEPGEYSETDLGTASAALSTMDSAVSAPTGRLYTIPRGVQSEAKKALNWHERYARGGTDVSLHTAGLLASGGQVGFNQLRHISTYFARHKSDKFSNAWEPLDNTPPSARITWGMWGGDAGEKWASSILNREGEKALTADGIFIPESTPNASADPYSDAFNLDTESAPEFLARVRMDGSGIDRLYKIDADQHVYVWDDAHWDDMGTIDGDIYAYDAALDMSDEGEIVELIGKSHVVIDPASALILGNKFQQNPFTPVPIEDINPDEAALVVDALPEIDWDAVDSAIVAAAPDLAPGQYSPDERSQNASQQMRTSDGRFATQGQRVTVGGQGNGVITQVNTSNQTVNVQLDGGGTTTVPARQVASEKANEPAASIPGNPVAIPKIDLTGILAEPRTPINFKGAQLPGTLPAMTSRDIHDMLYNWPAYVASQRTSFKPQTTRMNSIPVQSANSTDDNGAGVTTEVYDNPLIANWLRKTRNSHETGGRYQAFSITPVTAGAVPPPGELETPDSSNVQPVFLAVVAPDDPTAVTQLISLVPASSSSNSPMVYTRKDGEWSRDERTLMDLQSATPPPVVPLDTQTLQDCLSQVDDKHGEMAQQDAEAEQQAPTTEISGGPIDSNSNASAPAPVAASSLSVDQALMLLWGPREDIVQAAAITAAGGPDRNRGQAEKLRRYWEHGEGAAKIQWGTPGDWTRCFRNLSKYMGERAKGYCALRHKEVDHMWPGDKRNREMASRLDGTYTTDVLVPEEVFIDTFASSVRAQMAHDRLRGLVAGATSEGVPIYGEMPVPGDAHGASFYIPTILPLGLESGDTRIIDDDAELDIRDLPLPLLWQINTASGHDGAVVVGRIDSMEITETGIKNGRGVFDIGTYGREAERMVRAKMLRGVSADMDKFEANEVAVFAEDDEQAFEGTPLVPKKQVVVNKTRIMAVTIVAKPAFQECQIFLIEEPISSEEDEMIPDMEDGLYTDEADPIEAAALVAAGYVAEHIPVAPPKEWFENPNLSHPSPITVTDDGRVFGHIASWNQDHIGMANNIKPPRSRSNYAYFQTGVLRTAEGDDVSVGQLTLAGGHASLNFSAREAVKHYDDTASAIADVKAGEDSFGIWVSGALRPGTSPEQVRVFRASAPSGDWRPIKGKLELVAVCQVNVPGFPVARAMVAGGQATAIVAAGAATIARLKGDPIAEMQDRLAKLEQFSTAELSAKADPIREKFAAVKQERDARKKAELAAQHEALSVRIRGLSEFASKGVTTSDDLNKEQIARKAVQEIKGGDADPKYTPKTQPRNEDGKFRLILARLRDGAGVSGNQEIIEKIKQAMGLNVGDYKAASLAYSDLFNTLSKIDSNSMDPGTRGTLRRASLDLASAVANLPLPFDDQSQKVRFSDLPPVLREMINGLVGKVKQEYGDKSSEKLGDINTFMSGGDYYSQSDVSTQMNHLLHLLTAKRGK